MNTFEFYQRLLRPLKPDSLESLKASDGLELVDALNYALQLFYRVAPDRHKRKAMSYFLPRPRVITISVTNGSKTIDTGLHDESGNVILTEDEQALESEGVIVVQANSIGSSIRIDGDANWNRIDGENLLRDAYQGETGSRTATIYGDVIALDGLSIERMANDPKLDTGESLAHDDLIRQYGTAYDTYFGESSESVGAIGDTYGYRAANDRKLGRPQRYYIGHLGDRSYGKVELQGLVVLDPIPLTPYNVTFDAFWKPLRFKLDTLTQNAVILPLPDDLMETILVPLAVNQLTQSDLWKNERGIAKAERNAETAMALINTLSNHVAVPDNIAGTPRGY
jgi:hypothetical protein